jgi:hypothetical protein
MGNGARRRLHSGLVQKLLKPLRRQELNIVQFQLLKDRSQPWRN